MQRPITEYEISTKQKNILIKKHIETTADLLRLFPRVYHDFRCLLPLSPSLNGKYIAFSGRILNKKQSVSKTGNRFIQITMRDALTGQPCRLMWFAYNMVCRYFNVGDDIFVAGKLTYHDIYGYSCVNPVDLGFIREFEPCIDAVYPKYSGISEQVLTELIEEALLKAEVPELIPDHLLQAYKLPRLTDALLMIHAPKELTDISVGLGRVVIDDLLRVKLNLRRKAKPVDTLHTFDKNVTDPLMKQIKAYLPFTLNPSQEDCLDKICLKMSSGVTQTGIIQGDVGSGKTIIAIILCILAAKNGFQSVFLAPTKVLAAQHYEKMQELAELFDIRVSFLAGANMKKADLAPIADGSSMIIVGTHSVLSDKVSYKNLGLVIADEEHKFGVKQREKLITDGIHFISMSATPMPRTIANSIYGEHMDVYTISKPACRQEVTTTMGDMKNAKYLLKQELSMGHQAYIVCPSIEDQEDASDVMSLREAENIYGDFLKKAGYTYGVIHGKQDDQQTDEALAAFKNGEISVLLSTTVIEVGVDVPNATLIVIQNAERFGLAGLHQLRGRVGRSDMASYCLLVTKNTEKERLKKLCESQDGYELALADLSFRGMGDITGEAQSGMTRIAEEILQYPKLWEMAGELAEKISTDSDDKGE